jgi:hypothetical protein
MKKTFILLSLLVLAFSANVFAQKTKPATKTPAKQAAKQITASELFLLLPDDYITMTSDERSDTLEMSTTPKPDYLGFMVTGENIPKSLKGTFAEPEGLGNMRVFHGKSSVFVGLRYQIGDAAEENPTVDSVKITTFLLEYKDGKWSDVTASLLPQISIDEAHKLLSENDPEAKIKKENVWIQTDISDDFNGFLLFGRIKGSDSATNLKTFKWDGIKFVEVINE